jgi:hypothetical protein
VDEASDTDLFRITAAHAGNLRQLQDSDGPKGMTDFERSGEAAKSAIGTTSQREDDFEMGSNEATGGEAQIADDFEKSAEMERPSESAANETQMVDNLERSDEFGAAEEPHVDPIFEKSGKVAPPSNSGEKGMADSERSDEQEAAHDGTLRS